MLDCGQDYLRDGKPAQAVIASRMCIAKPLNDPIGGPAVLLAVHWNSSPVPMQGLRVASRDDAEWCLSAAKGRPSGPDAQTDGAVGSLV